MGIKEELTKNTTTYACAICNKKHSNIADRIACETKCLDERNKAEEAMKKQKLELEKQARMKEIELTYEELNDLISAYVEDYGYIQIATKYKNDCDCDCTPSLTHLFDFWSM